MEKKSIAKFLTFVITVGVLVVLIFSAPAQAYILKLNVPTGVINKGDVVSFSASIQRSSTDKANITSIQLKLVGPLDVVCSFKPNGEIISGCDGISIKLVSDCYGYGGCDNYGYDNYGYNNYGYPSETQNLMYNFSVNTSNLFSGTYKTSLTAFSGNNPINNVNGDNFKVGQVAPPPKSCSIRAKNGDFTIEGNNFGSNNKINFYIPLKNAKSGEGFITAQKGRITLSYKFNVGEVLEKDENHTAVSVSGKYRVDLQPEKEEKSVLVLDKVNKKISVIGKNLNIVYMNVNFEDGEC